MSINGLNISQEGSPGQYKLEMGNLTKVNLQFYSNENGKTQTTGVLYFASNLFCSANDFLSVVVKIWEQMLPPEENCIFNFTS